MDQELNQAVRPRLAAVADSFRSTLLRTGARVSRRLLRRKRHRDFVEGPPEGLSRQTLELVVHQQLGPVALERIRHEHISGWKRTGAFRVHLDTVNGAEWSFVFKNACYRIDEIPALDGLPLSPGPPEHLVYRACTQDLLRYLPEVYQSRQITSGSHYHHILEDLSRRHVRLRQPQLAWVVSQELHAIHGALGTAMEGHDLSGFLRFDQECSEGLLEYSAAALHQLGSKQPLRRLQSVISSWDRIERIYRRGLAFTYDLVELGPIHGDLNPTNVWADPNDPRQLRLLDWEWAGVGVPHADLVSVCQGGTRETELEAVRRYNLVSGKRTVDEDHGVFSWCKLQRYLLDAAFFARHLLEARRAPRSLDLERTIERKLEIILRTAAL